MCDGSNGHTICAHKDLHVGPIFVAMATTFALGAESNRLPACLYTSLQLAADVDARLRLRSANSMTLVVPSTRGSTLGDRAFPLSAASC